MTGSEDQPADLEALLVHLDAYTWKLDGDMPISPEDLRALSDAAEALAPLGAKARLAGNIDELLRQVVAAARPGDHLLCMSNGGFGGIHQKLLAALRTGQTEFPAGAS